MMGFRCVLFILGISNPGGVVPPVVAVFGNVCVSDIENSKVVVDDEKC
jgi:hypothetical protein